MTLAQQYRAEGHTEGHHLGVIRSTQQHVVETLEIRFSAVPEGLRDAVFAISDEAKLRLLFHSAVRCVSLEAFAEGL